MSVAQDQLRAPPPDRVPADRVVDFDYLRDPNPDDPFVDYRRLSEHPHELIWSTANGGHWIVTRNELLFDMIQKPELFSNRHTSIPPTPYHVRQIPEELDPPEHTKYRAIISPRLGPKMMREFEAKSQKLARELVDRVHAEGRADLMRALTIPLPCGIFLEMMGLPTNRTEEFVAWKDDFFYGGTDDKKKAANERIVVTLQEAIDEKRRAPADDLLSFLVCEAEVDGRPLDNGELMSFAILFFFAGLDTVTAVMSACFLYFANNPVARDRVVADPTLANAAVEEIIRRYSVVNVVRTATQDFEWAGALIRQGDQFVGSTLMANLDEREFAHAMEVDFEREGNRHLGFGGGPHRCVGSHLARVELRAVLQEALPRLKNLRMQAGASARFHVGALVGLATLPVEWDVA